MVKPLAGILIIPIFSPLHFGIIGRIIHYISMYRLNIQHITLNRLNKFILTVFQDDYDITFVLFKNYYPC